ncbi:PAS domain-containing protein [Halosegnis sp.]|uniref:PAS domain-containing sensor histidine kinase n=1 Tax=Halosegnis sp. TaxID=2864959 RepID=UPI0035D509DB
MNGFAGQDAQSLLDALPDLFFAFDTEGTLTWWNEAVPAVTGYTETDLTEMTPADFFADVDTDRLAAATAELRETGTTTIEGTLETAAGEQIPYEFTAGRVANDSSVVFVGVGRDITARRAAEREQRAILDRMGDGFFAVDTDWRLTYVNERGAHLLARAMGRDPEATTFKRIHLWDEIPDAVDTTFYEQYHHAVDTGEPVSFEEYFAPLDEWFDVRAFPDETGLSVYFREITAQRRTRDRLEHREQLLKDMYDVTADRGASFDDQVSRLLALGRAEFGTEYGSLSQIMGDEYRFEIVDADDDSIQSGDVVPLAATNCEVVASRTETIAWGDIAADAPDETDRAGYTDWGISCYLGAPVYDNDGVYGTFCFYGTDTRANEFGEWETTLVELMSRWVSYELQRQNDRLEQFASIVSHDLRNPLSVANGRLELAQRLATPRSSPAVSTRSNGWRRSSTICSPC